MGTYWASGCQETQRKKKGRGEVAKDFEIDETGMLVKYVRRASSGVTSTVSFSEAGEA